MPVLICASSRPGASTQDVHNCTVQAFMAGDSLVSFLGIAHLLGPVMSLAARRLAAQSRDRAWRCTGSWGREAATAWERGGQEAARTIFTA